MMNPGKALQAEMLRMMEQPRLNTSQLTTTIRLDRAIRAIEQLRQDGLALEQEFAPELQSTALACRESAYNLIHYLALRRHDIRELQYDLSTLGLSSLGRTEAHVMASLNAVLVALYRCLNQPVDTTLIEPTAVTFELGREILAKNTLATLGPIPQHRIARIMVTMPSAAAEDPRIIHNLLADGMDVMRINCAHDGPDAWLRMIQHLRQAEKHLSRSCKILFDLAGPKLRTAAIAPEAEVVKWRPQRNLCGQVTQPARICFTTASEAMAQPGEVVLPLQTGIEAQVGDEIQLIDARQRQRILEVVAVTDTGCCCTCDRTGYVTSGTPLTLRRQDQIVGCGAIGRLTALPGVIPLQVGDRLIVTPEEILGHPAVVNDRGEVIEPATIGCTLPQIFQDVRPGERLFFDDGKLEGIIREVAATQFEVEIVAAARGITKLRAEKGMNLPDTVLNLPALSAKDLQDLELIVQHADLVALSFVQRPSDIEQLLAALEQLRAGEIGIVLKIETRRGFEHLPKLLITAMQRPPLAVMIARGDLGVEVGFERMSEIQEEILLLCEAAHVPVIWATQVLESLVKGGLPSRAEVTDAATSSRAECVMLNKGPYIEMALRFLDDVLHRMKDHHEKNMAMLRKLRVSEIEPESGAIDPVKFPET
jgi:pyruvate kinase